MQMIPVPVDPAVAAKIVALLNTHTEENMRAAAALADAAANEAAARARSCPVQVSEYAVGSLMFFLAACKSGDNAAIAAFMQSKTFGTFRVTDDGLAEVLRVVDESSRDVAELYQLLTKVVDGLSSMPKFVDCCWRAAVKRTPPEQLAEQLKQLPPPSANCVESLISSAIPALFEVVIGLDMLPKHPSRQLLARAVEDLELATRVKTYWSVSQQTLVELAYKLSLCADHFKTLRALGLSEENLHAAAVYHLNHGTLDFAVFLAAEKLAGPFTQAELENALMEQIVGSRYLLAAAIMKRLYGDNATTSELAELYRRSNRPEASSKLLQACTDLPALVSLLKQSSRFERHYVYTRSVNAVLFYAIRAGDCATLESLLETPRAIEPRCIDALAALRAVDEPAAVEIVRVLAVNTERLLKHVNAERFAARVRNPVALEDICGLLPDAEALFLNAGSLAATRAIGAAWLLSKTGAEGVPDAPSCAEPTRFLFKPLLVAAFKCPAFVSELTADFFATPEMAFRVIRYCLKYDWLAQLSAIFAVLEPAWFDTCSVSYREQFKGIFASAASATVLAMLGTPSLWSALGACGLQPSLDASTVCEHIDVLVHNPKYEAAPTTAVALAALAASGLLLPALQANRGRLLKHAYALECTQVLAAARAAGLSGAAYAPAMPELGYIAADRNDCELLGELVFAGLMQTRVS